MRNDLAVNLRRGALNGLEPIVGYRLLVNGQAAGVRIEARSDPVPASLQQRDLRGAGDHPTVSVADTGGHGAGLVHKEHESGTDRVDPRTGDRLHTGGQPGRQDMGLQGKAGQRLQPGAGPDHPVRAAMDGLHAPGPASVGVCLDPPRAERRRPRAGAGTDHSKQFGVVAFGPDTAHLDGDPVATGDRHLVGVGEKFRHVEPPRNGSMSSGRPPSASQRNLKT